jgi:hypothetical protein
MKIANEKPAYTRVTRREGMLSLLGGALFLAGCGGGSDKNDQAAVNTGGTGSTPTGPTTSADVNGSLSAGPIVGLGSVILSGVRFEDREANVVDEDEQPFPGGRDGLKLGMMCRVKGRGKSRKSDKTDKADKIICMSELLGPVDSVPAATTAPTTMVVMGQTVKITACTIFEEGLGLTGDKILAVNDIVEVHGYMDHRNNVNVMTATRIELKKPAEIKPTKMRGIVSALTTTSFKIGGFTIDFDASTDMGKLILKDGMVVRVKLTLTVPAVTSPPTPAISGKAIKIREVEKEKETEDRENVEIKGTITECTSNANFVVNSVTIDASGVAGVPVLKVGDRVECEGRMVNKVLKATKCKLEDDNDPVKFVLYGKVTGSRTDGKLKFTFDVTTTGGTKLNHLTVDKSVNFTNSLHLADLRADHGGLLIIEGMAQHDGSGNIRATRIGLAPLGTTV